MAQSPLTSVNQAVARHRDRAWLHHLPILAMVAAGGVAGAEARYGLQHAFPHAPTGFAWATFAINVSGCLLIGVLMTLVTRLWPGQRLIRPFFGVGVLGGYTTFSTYAVDIAEGLKSGAPGTALVYLATTLIAAMIAVWAGTEITTRFLSADRLPPPGEPALVSAAAGDQATADDIPAVGDER